MTSTFALAAVSVLALGLLAPTASAQEAKPGITNPTAAAATNLYFHVVDALNDMPINTQKPDEKYQRSFSVGLATATTTCLSQADKDQLDNEYHQFFGYSSPGYVEYNFTGSDGLPRVHPERAISYNVEIDPSVPFVLKWYIATFTGAPQSQGLPTNSADEYLVIPNVAVEAWVRSGESISTNNDAYKQGAPIAHGRTVGHLGRDALTQSTEGGTVTYHAEPNPGGGTYAVYEYTIPLALAGAPLIQKEHGYNVQVAVYLDNPKCDQSQTQDKVFMPNVVKLYTSPASRPHMELAIKNAIRIEYMHPQFVGDDLVLHTSSNSPWGNYDVDEYATPGTSGTKGGIEVAVKGPSEARGLYRAAVVQRYHEHDHHTQAVDVTFVWPYKQENAQGGVYTISLSVKNDQGTALATGVAQFEIGKNKVTKCGNLESVAGAKTDQGCIDEYQDDSGQALAEPPKTSPNLELVGILGALGAVAVLVRRRRLA